MARKYTFERNEAGIRQLLQSEEMRKGLAQMAANIVGRAGTGYDSNTNIGENRASARVYTTDKATFKENLKTNALLKFLR